MSPSFAPCSPTLWGLDKARVTETDTRRTQMYRAEKKRQQLACDTPELDVFIASLGLRVAIYEAHPEDLSRAAQLTQRTNQFNATTSRRTREQLEREADRPGASLWMVDVTDRFGEYGQVGLVGLTQRATSLDVPLFMLSCRVLGRRVENVISAWLRDYAARHELDCVAIPFRPTARNAPFAQFLQRSPWSAPRDDSEHASWTVSASILEAEALAAMNVEVIHDRRLRLPAAPPPVDVISKGAIDHIGVAVRQLDPAIHSLLEQGYTLVARAHDPIQRSELAMLSKPDHVRVELVRALDDRSPTARMPDQTPYHLCLRVVSIQDTIASWSRVGIDASAASEAAPAVLFDQRLVQFFVVPGVGLIELVESEDLDLGSHRDALVIRSDDPRRASDFLRWLGYAGRESSFARDRLATVRLHPSPDRPNVRLAPHERAEDDSPRLARPPVHEVASHSASAPYARALRLAFAHETMARTRHRVARRRAHTIRAPHTRHAARRGESVLGADRDARCRPRGHVL